MILSLKPLIIGFVLLYTMTSCIEYKDVEFMGITDYSMTKLNANEVKISLNMKIKNPNNYTIKIKKSVFDLFLNDKELGQTSMLNDLKLEKNRSQIHDVVFESNLKDISSGIFSSLGILFGGKATLRIKGKLKAKAFGVGKKFDVDFAQDIKASDLKF